MLMRMCAERPKDWDKYIDPLLFAYREAPQESLGFSPFELLYGWPVRGPMQILKQLWSKEIEDPEVRSTYQYVVELRDRLESTLAIAQDNLSKMSRKYKRHYDQKAGKRQLRRYAANDKIFKLFFLYPFLASTIYNNTIKNKFDIG